MINVIFAINQTTWDLLKQNFQRDVDGIRLRTDLTVEQASKLRSNIFGHWKVPNIAGTDYHVISWYVPSTTWIEFLLTEYPGKFIIVGAWRRDGSQFGTTIVPATYDENLVEATPETVIGTPQYPIHAQYMKIFPDDVTYDQNGNELTRSAAAAPKEVNKLFGWSDRRWT